MEDGTFKSDRITVGDRCTLGTSAFCHYATTIGDGAVIRTDAFLMKGSEVGPGTCWGGNPAHELAGRTRPSTGPAPPGQGTPSERAQAGRAHTR